MSKALKQIEVKVIARESVDSFRPVQHYQHLIVEGEDEAYHRQVSAENPECWVNIYFSDGGFIYGIPHNMERDERLWKAGELTWDEYKAKWYPGL